MREKADFRGRCARSLLSRAYCVSSIIVINSVGANFCASQQRERALSVIISFKPHATVERGTGGVGIGGDQKLSLALAKLHRQLDVLVRDLR